MSLSAVGSLSLPIDADASYSAELEAGIEDVRLHDLRHNYASLAARSSETLPMIAELLGHRDIRTTSQYAHLDDQYLVDASNATGANLMLKIGY